MKADGLADTQQGRGTFVLAQSAPPPFRRKAPVPNSAQSIIELAKLRLGVEGAAAALAAQRRTPEQLTRLKDCLDRMEQSLRGGISGTEADLEFHQTIADATGNKPPPHAHELFTAVFRDRHRNLQVTERSRTRPLAESPRRATRNLRSHCCKGRRRSRSSHQTSHPRCRSADGPAQAAIAVFYAQRANLSLLT